MYHVKLTRFGQEIGMTLPAEALAKLGLKEGDSLLLRDTPDGLRLDRANSDDPAVMRAFEETAAEHRETLRRLAK